MTTFGLNRPEKRPSLRAIIEGWRHVTAINLTTPPWRFVARSTLAAGLALVVAFYLHLETPYSAASTVLLVANPNQGAVLAKGGWRLIGTLIGGLAAVALMALFIQTPALFLFGLGTWLGLCACAATVLRHFRASGVAVAGYTVGLATYGALEMPEHALDAVLGRTATVAVGVVCLGIVTALLSGRATRAKLESVLAAQLITIGRLIATRMQDADAPTVKPDLVAGMFVIDDLLELSSTESPDVAIRAGAVREGMAALFGALLGASALPAPASDDPATLTAARQRIALALPNAIGNIERGHDSFEAARDHLAALRHALHQMVRDAEKENSTSPHILIILDRLTEVIEDYEAALMGLIRLHGRTPHRTGGFRFHRDWCGGLRNGVRALLAILCGGAFGIATGWNDWSLLTLILAPYVVLLAMIGDPEAGAIAFIKGTVAAIPAAWLCTFVLLPAIDGLPLLLAAAAPFWIAGLYGLTIPRFAPVGLAYLVTFNTLTGASNPMTWDPLAFANQAFGWVVAVIVTWLVFRLLLPPQPRRQAERIATALWRDVLAVIASGSPVGRAKWEHLQHHRLVRIAQSLKGDAATTASLLGRGLDNLHIGRTALRLRANLQRAAESDPTAPIIFAALAKVGKAPKTAAAVLRDTAQRIAGTVPAGEAARQAQHRSVAGLVDMASLLDRHGGDTC
jgi:uncharacterized membrane protein YccC